jgi:NADPH:quinone reductase-like Zn-dependent oxidoreductase
MSTADVVPPALPRYADVGSMDAVVMSDFGGPEVLELTRVPAPDPGPGEAVIEVATVSVGRTLDIAARSGHLPFAKIEPPHILGAEHAGIVVAVGDSADREWLGRRVAVFPAVGCGECTACVEGHDEACERLELIGVHRPGAYAQYSLVPVANLHAVPESVSEIEASALALGGPVATNQLEAAGVRPGAWVLVIAAGSALGSLTALLAERTGARVIGTSRSEWKRRQLEDLGVMALDIEADDFVEKVMEATSGGVDIVVDNIGSGVAWGKSMAVLASRGVVVSSGGFVGEALPLNLRDLYTRNLRVLGVRTGNLRSVDRFWSQVDATLRPVIARTFPLREAAAAHRYVEEDRNFGRVVLTIDTDRDPAQA